MRSLRVGAFVPVCGCFHQLSTSSHASPSIHSTRPQWSIYCACLYGAQRREVCDPLISCVWHVNFGWLSTNNPTSLQEVSSNICNFFDSFRYSLHAFDLQLFLVGAQRIESGLIIFWHILDVFLTFNLSCVFVQLVRFHEFRPLMSLPKHDRL